MESQFYNFQTLEKGTFQIIKILREINQDIQSNPSRLITPNVLPGFLRSQLSEDPPNYSTSIQQIIKDTKQKYFPGIMLWNSPKYFGFEPSNISAASIASDIFTHSFHSPGFNYDIAPSITQMQNVMADWSAKSLGLPQKFLMKNNGGGLINNVASQNMFVIVHAAKYKKMKDLHIDLTDPRFQKFVGYYTQYAYQITEKSLLLKDIAYRRPVPCYYCQKRQNLCVDIIKFKQLLKEDIQNGLIPFFYGISYGSSFSCSIDLQEQLIQICQQNNMWINVDGAYLAAKWICEQQRPKIQLLQKVNSILVNFSKALYCGNGGSLMFISDRQLLTTSMGAKINYDFFKNRYTGNNDIVDYKDWIVGLNRVKNGLRFYFMYRLYGLDKIKQHARSMIKKAQYFQSLIEKSNIFKKFCKRQFGLVCFQVLDKNGLPSKKFTEEVSKLITDIPEGYCTQSNLKQYKVIHMSIGNAQTTEKDILKFFNAIQKIAYQQRQLNQCEQKTSLNKHTQNKKAL